MPPKTYKLPYLNSMKLVLLTVALNLVCAFFFQFSLTNMLRLQMEIDGALSGALTALINTVVIYTIMSRRRAQGIVARQVPLSQGMQKLPASLGGLVAVNVVLFGAVGYGLSALFLRFFAVQILSVPHWLVLKLIFVCVLSAKIIEFVVLRLVQPDWQESYRATAQTKFQDQVRNPLPSGATAIACYKAVAANIAMNIVMGYLMGDVRLQMDQTLVVQPTNSIGMGITGIILGGLTAYLVTSSVLQELPSWHAAWSEEEWARVSATQKGEFWLRLLPHRNIPLRITVCVLSMLVSALILPQLMRIIERPELNFLQFCVLITLYGSVLSKVLASLLVARCTRKDW